ncbi:MAG TPA: pyridoxal phosphate-dependent aminotransferase [Vicinamibacterales bacterium]|nr:pyridoxal phosphate-dependent aminotransferase [Vicinamibacterales bacterium]
MFSSRLPAALAPNAITRAVSALRDRQVAFLDLTETNPTRVGVTYPPDLLRSLADPAAAAYQPESLGLPQARAAIAAEYAADGVIIDPDRIVLTASTSEAYALLFKLLADPGDQVLVPQPSYPLFESLTSLEAVVSTPYHLDYHGVWSIDRDSLMRAANSRTRAVLVVSPNNPTGSMLRSADRDWLASLCREREWALIADEVFAGYPLRPARDAVSCAGEARALTFVLGGLSKSAGLPQLKLGWIAVSGPDALVRQSIERLDLMCDTYLSVSTPVQVAAPALLAAGRSIRDSIRTRISTNLASLERLLAGASSMTLLPPEGGWSVALRVPAVEPEEALVLRLLRDYHVLVHPGFFFDFASEAYIVVSLLPEPSAFDTAMGRVITSIAEGPAS